MFKFFQRKKTMTPRGLPTVIRGRAFAAASVDRLLDGWRYDGGFTPGEITAHLGIIRGRARQMSKDSPHFKRWLDLCSINIVGADGFALKSTPYDRDGKGGVRLDEQAARFIEFHWWKFCTGRDRNNNTFFDSTGRKTAAEMDRLNVRNWKRDGEYFVHIIKTADPLNPYGITFRVLRPDWCDHKLNIEKTGRGTLIHCGVEKDIKTRRPVAYYFASAPDSPYSEHIAGRTVTRIPANEIIHGFTQQDEDQPRGIPESHAILRKLAMLDQYDIAELTAARDEACTVRAYTAQDGADPMAFVDLLEEGQEDNLNAYTAEKEPGQVEVLPRGYKMEAITPQHPNRNAVEYKAGLLKDLASGLGVEYSNWANDWRAVSFSSVRAGTIAERDHWMTEQQSYIDACKTPMFLAWLESFLTLAVSGQLPIEKYDKFSEHEFRGRRWMWVDPVKDVKAAEIAVDRGWKTNTDVAADFGSDYEDNIDQIKRETEKEKGTRLEGRHSYVQGMTTITDEELKNNEKD